MIKKKKLSKTMSVEDFQQQYWYLSELREFAVEINIPGAKKLRKDELEREIVQFLASGKVSKSLPKRMQSSSKKGVKDSERGLKLSLPVDRFTWDYATKDFLELEIARKMPKLALKSGEKYWMQRWLEKMTEDAVSITYEDVVNHLISLRTTKGRLPRIPSTRYNNFITDYLAEYPGSSKTEAQEAWEELKELPVEKSFPAYKKYQAKNKK